jgi:hypothetical protein
VRTVWLLALCMLVALPLGAATIQLDSDDITYLGYFRLPDADPFNNGAKDITLVPDCMGETDPTPVGSDGYGGCILTVGKNNGGQFPMRMTDIVPPTLTGSNTSAAVGAEFEPLGTLYGTVGCDGTGCNLTDPEATIYYDQSGCTLVWSAYNEYATSPKDTDYAFGTSSCSISTPNPQGMYRFDDESDVNTLVTDPYRVTKWIYNIKKIPSAIATDYFGGNQMLLGPGKCTGSRGSSAGASFGVRPWTFPTGSGGWDGFVPIFYYNSPTGYPRWYQATDFQSPAPSPACAGVEDPHTCCTGVGTGCTGRDWSIDDRIAGVEAIRIAYGGDNYEAALFIGRANIVDPNVFPASSLGSTATEQASDPVPDSRNGSWGTYGSWDGTLYPDLDEVPIAWYGIQVYSPTNIVRQQPSVTDYASDGSFIPYDSNIVANCTGGTGPNSQARRLMIWLYDLAELGNMYDNATCTAPATPIACCTGDGTGTCSSYGPEDIDPYAEIYVPFDPNNDGVLSQAETCIQSGRQYGMAYDHTNDILYISAATDPGTSGPPYADGYRRGILMFKIDPSGGAGGGTIWEQRFEAGSITGGTVQ